jgi:hypothetical protein
MLLFKKINIWLFFMIVSYQGYCQAIIDVPIILSGEADSTRMIKNLSRADHFTAPLRQNELISQAYLYHETDALDTVEIQTGLSLNALPDGFKIYLKYQGVNKGAVFIQTDSLPFMQILKQGASLKVNELYDDLLELVFLNNNYHWINSEAKCPAGYVRINNFCIEEDESNSVSFFNAMQVCFNRGGRLCTMQEWTTACINNNGEIKNMTGNWEWINDFQDHGTNGSTMGGVNCTGTASRTNTHLYFFRCCIELEKND